MSVTFSPLRQNGNRFDLALPSGDDSDLSLSNANTYDALDALGIEDPYSSSPWPIACFRSLLTVAPPKALEPSVAGNSHG